MVCAREVLHYMCEGQLNMRPFVFVGSCHLCVLDDHGSRCLFALHRCAWLLWLLGPVASRALVGARRVAALRAVGLHGQDWRRGRRVHLERRWEGKMGRCRTASRVGGSLRVRIIRGRAHEFLEGLQLPRGAPLLKSKEVRPHFFDKHLAVCSLELVEHFFYKNC